MPDKCLYRLVTIISLLLLLTGCSPDNTDLEATIDAQETIIAQSVQSIPDGTLESDAQETATPEPTQNEDSSGLTSRIQDAISTLVDPFIGYDLKLDSTSEGKDYYTIGIALVNTTDKLLNPSLPDPILVTTQEGGQYIAQFQTLVRVINRDRSTDLSTVSGGPLEYIFIPPSSIILESTSFAGGVQLINFSWILNFAVPEGEKLDKIEMPGVAEIDLKNVMSRSEIRFPFPANPQFPFNVAIGDFINMTVSNPRSYMHPTLGSALAFDVDFINNDLIQSHHVSYSFSIIDAFGTLLEFHSNECGDPNRDDVLPWPVNGIDLAPGQQVNGVTCILLNPDGYDGLSEYWVLNALEEIDPHELGLDPEGVMEVEGIEATFDELRQGIELPDGRFIIWIGNKRLGRIEIYEKQLVSFRTPLINDKHLLYIWAREPVRGAVGPDIDEWYIQAVPLND